jgi:hypothetical protein
MSRAAHLAELERRHRALESEIIEARAHPSIDNLQIAEMKRRKLLVKDEIERLQTLIGRNSSDGFRSQLRNIGRPIFTIAPHLLSAGSNKKGEAACA